MVAPWCNDTLVNTYFVQHQRQHEQVLRVDGLVISHLDGTPVIAWLGGERRSSRQKPTQGGTSFSRREGANCFCISVSCGRSLHDRYLQVRMHVFFAAGRGKNIESVSFCLRTGALAVLLVLCYLLCRTKRCMRGRYVREDGVETTIRPRPWDEGKSPQLLAGRKGMFPVEPSIDFVSGAACLKRLCRCLPLRSHLYPVQHHLLIDDVVVAANVAVAANVVVVAAAAVSSGFVFLG